MRLRMLFTRRVAIRLNLSDFVSLFCDIFGEYLSNIVALSLPNIHKSVKYARAPLTRGSVHCPFHLLRDFPDNRNGDRVSKELICLPDRHRHLEPLIKTL